MDWPKDPTEREELFELYSELHLSCERAAATLRLGGHLDEADDELVRRFREEEQRATRIWRRIQKLTTEDG